MDMEEFVDSLLIAGTTWELLAKRAGEEAQRRNTATLCTLEQLKAHIAYREQAGWRYEQTEMGVRVLHMPR
jgi:hypothetical protein